MPRGGGGGGALIFSYIRRLGSFLCVKFRISIFVWVFRKVNIFLGMKLLWIIFGDHHKIGLYLGVISMHFRGLFLTSRYRMGDMFWGC